MKARAGGEKGRHLRPRLVQKVAEGKTSYELCGKVKVMVKKKKKKKNDLKRIWRVAPLPLTEQFEFSNRSDRPARLLSQALTDKRHRNTLFLRRIDSDFSIYWYVVHVARHVSQTDKHHCVFVCRIDEDFSRYWYVVIFVYMSYSLIATP